MSYTDFDFPRSHFYDDDLRELIKMYKKFGETLKTFVSANKIKFADPIIWNITTQYPIGTIVLNTAGNAYLSTQPVPVGIELNNENYWQEIFNFTDYTRTANKNLTVNVETNTTRATRTYNVDDWLIWNDVLYKVTTVIVIDDTLIAAPAAGANIIHFTVEDFIKAFMEWATNIINQYKDDIDASELQYKNDTDASILAYKNNTDASILAYKNYIDASELQYRQQLAQDIATTTESLQNQLNAAIAGVTIDSEVINARVGADGITYSTLGDAIRQQFIANNSGILGLSVTAGHPIQQNDFKAEQYNASTGTFTPNTGRATSKYIGINRGSDIYWDATKWHLNYFVVRDDNSYIWSPNVWNTTGHIKFNYANNANIVIQLRKPNDSNVESDLPLMNKQIIVFSNQYGDFYHGIITGTTIESNNQIGFYSLGGYNASPTSDMVDMPVDDFAGGFLLNTFCGNSGATSRQDLVEIPISTRAARHFTRIDYGDWFGVGQINWVAYGDSITNGSYSEGSATLNSSTHSYAFRIAKTIKRDEINEFYNCSVRGIGWLKSGNNNETFDDMLSLFTGDKTQINLVTIMLGINDYLSHNDPIGDENSTEKDGTISGNIRYGLRWLSENYNHAKIIVISPMNSTLFGSISSAWARHTYLLNPHTLQDVSDIIEYWCNYFGIKFIDELSAGVVNTYNCQQFMQDGIHPSNEGQWLLAYDLAKYI